MISFIILLQILREFFLFLNNYIPGKIMIEIDKETKFKSLKNLLASRKKDLDKTNKNTLVLKIYQSTSDFSVFIRDFIKFSANFIIVFNISKHVSMFGSPPVVKVTSFFPFFSNVFLILSDIIF